MNFLHHLSSSIYDKLGDSVFYLLGFMLIMSVVAMWRLYDKAGQPGVYSIIPGLNLIIFLKIIGRPAWHLVLFFIPIYGQLYLLPKVWIELCQSFGKRSILDYVLVIVLNGLCIFNLGLSYDTAYVGPAYGKSFHVKDPVTPSPSLA